MNTRLFDSFTWRRFLTGTDIELGHRQLFMLPTRMGLVFSLLLFALLMAAINYENGLSYALTFILAALGQVSMLYTHRNLLGIRFLAGSSAPVFSGQVARFRFSVRNDTAKPRYRVELTSGGEVFATVDLEPHEQKQVVLERPATKRGYLQIDDIKAHTRFPIGLLYSWTTRICLDQNCLVYPHPAPAGSFPLPVGGEDGSQPGASHHGEDFVGLRDYRFGDSLKQVHWKALARGRGMLTKQYGGGSGEKIWLDWSALQNNDPEQRIQILCRYVLDAEELQIDYGLRLPGMEILPACGKDHLHQCLKALALLELHD